MLFWMQSVAVLPLLVLERWWVDTEPIDTYTGSGGIAEALNGFSIFL